MNLDELQSVRSKERRTDSLQHLRDSFYGDVRDYLGGLKAERDAAAERADDPFASPEVRQLTDEIESAKEVVEAIYERRMGKLVKHASLVAAGMEPDEEGMTTEERELFFDIVDRIRDNKETVLGTIEGDDDTTAESAAGTPAEGVSAAAAMAGTDADESAEASDTLASDAAADRSADRDDAPATSNEGSAVDASSSGGNPDPSGDAPSPDTEPPDADREGPSPTERLEADDRVMLRITTDVGEILGVDDRAYDLESEDVVALPRQNAEPLLEREAAEKLE